MDELLEGRLDAVLKVQRLDDTNRPKPPSHSEEDFGISPIITNKKAVSEITKMPVHYTADVWHQSSEYHQNKFTGQYIDHDLKRLKKTLSHHLLSGHNVKVYRHRDGKKQKGYITKQGEFIMESTILEALIANDPKALKESIVTAINERVILGIKHQKGIISKGILTSPKNEIKIESEEV